MKPGSLYEDIDRGSDVILEYVLEPLCVTVLFLLLSPIIVPAWLIGRWQRMREEQEHTNDQ